MSKKDLYTPRFADLFRCRRHRHRHRHRHRQHHRHRHRPLHARDRSARLLLRWRQSGADSYGALQAIRFAFGSGRFICTPTLGRCLQEPACYELFSCRGVQGRRRALSSRVLHQPRDRPRGHLGPDGANSRTRPLRVHLLGTLAPMDQK